MRLLKYLEGGEDRFGDANGGGLNPGGGDEHVRSRGGGSRWRFGGVW